MRPFGHTFLLSASVLHGLRLSIEGRVVGVLNRWNVGEAGVRPTIGLRMQVVDLWFIGGE